MILGEVIIIRANTRSISVVDRRIIGATSWVINSSTSSSICFATIPNESIQSVARHNAGPITRSHRFYESVESIVALHSVKNVLDECMRGVDY